ncbi:double zinc ribbon domain-containing protein [Sabulicella glaciei]|nr:double zinc ribbon domain-containing protein [Roseococcus sp. MDT2-1-1]
MRVSAPGRALGRWALDALFPPACLSCDTLVAEQGGLCPPCFARPSPVSAPHCLRCGVPFAHNRQGEAVEGGALCPGCAAFPPASAEARAALRYDAGSKALILPFKHRDRTEMAAPLARMMLRAGRAMLEGADARVPVPLHRWRLLSRRHNQAALLAVALGRLAGRRLRRAVRHDAESRRVAPRAGGRRADSGATADACARALLAAGAARVSVLATACVPDPRLEGMA